jgi:hypothetical protein
MQMLSYMDIRSFIGLRPKTTVFKIQQILFSIMIIMTFHVYDTSVLWFQPHLYKICTSPYPAAYDSVIETFTVYLLQDMLVTLISEFKLVSEI